MDPLVTDADKFKQRAGAEMLSGLLRGTVLYVRARRPHCTHTHHRLKELAPPHHQSDMGLGPRSYGQDLRPDQARHGDNLGDPDFRMPALTFIFRRPLAYAYTPAVPAI